MLIRFYGSNIEILYLIAVLIIYFFIFFKNQTTYCFLTTPVRLRPGIFASTSERAFNPITYYGLRNSPSS